MEIRHGMEIVKQLARTPSNIWQQSLLSLHDFQDPKQDIFRGCSPVQPLQRLNILQYATVFLSLCDSLQRIQVNRYLLFAILVLALARQYASCMIFLFFFAIDSNTILELRKILDLQSLPTNTCKNKPTESYSICTTQLH